MQLLLILVYPGLIYLGLRFLEPRQVGLVVLSFLGLRIAVALRSKLIDLARTAGVAILAVGTVSLATALWGDPLGVLLSPALVSFSLLLAFGRTLRRPPSFVEKLARLRVEALSDDEVRYCRRVTQVWCGFFLLNGLVAAGLAVAASREVWLAYAGLVSYLLVGLVFSVEYVYRHWRFRRYLGAPADRLLRHVFPPRIAADGTSGSRQIG